MLLLDGVLSELAAPTFSFDALDQQLTAVRRCNLRDALLGLRNRLREAIDGVGLRFELTFLSMRTRFLSICRSIRKTNCLFPRSGR